MNTGNFEMYLSIIIVNWNQRRMLKNCLASFLPKIDPTNNEIIVVDNGSQDGSADMVADDFPQIHLIRNPDNKGFAAANNQALKVAQGAYTLLLNNDTLVHGDVLAHSCQYLDRHGEIAVLGCRVLNADGSLQITCSQYPTIGNLFLLTTGLWKLDWPRFLGKYQMKHWKRDTERDVDTVSGCYMMVRKGAIADIGVLDEQFFFFGEETDWCRRFREAGWKVRFAPVGDITHFGSVSARRHNHLRDVMLTQAMIRLHRKHNGLVASATIWALLLVFNSSRALFWGLRSVFSKNPNVRDRSVHFARVVREFFPVRLSVPGAN
jgi:GT2 family glycosyltransferase